jgi:hypothetical protein
VDHEYLHLVDGTKVPIIVSNDTGRAGDPYEEFLTEGRRSSNEKGWPGLEAESDENAGAALCYTYVLSYFRLHAVVIDNMHQIGDDGQSKFYSTRCSSFE